MTVRAVLLAFAALVLLAGASLGLSFLHLHGLSVPVALSIALVKAAVVVGVFMEIREAKLSSALAFATGIAFLLLLGGMVICDRATRDTPPLTPPPPVTRVSGAR